MKRFIYYGTCNAGTQEIVKRIIKGKIKDVTDITLYEGAITFSTANPYDKLELHCFNNLFYVIDIYKSNNHANIIEQHVKKIIKSKFNNHMTSSNNKAGCTFRVMISCENQFISMQPNTKRLLENYIAGYTRLKINRQGADKEFWLLSRHEGVCFFLSRLTKHTSYEKVLRKGELHPEIAYIMSWLAHVKKNDIIMDPFCGYGAIPYQLLKYFPSKYVYASDISNDMVQITKSKLTQKMKERCKVFCCDINSLENSYNSESVDAIITDPPWGFYEKIDNIALFYSMMLSKFKYVLKKEAVAVILTAKKEEFVNVLVQNKGFKLMERYDVLISGKKAAIFKLVKI